MVQSQSKGAEQACIHKARAQVGTPVSPEVTSMPLLPLGPDGV